MNIHRSVGTILVAVNLAAACARPFPPDQAGEGHSLLEGARWASAGELTEPRELPRLARLGDGTVLMVGGGSELRRTALRSTALFDPATSQWRPGPDMGSPRRDPEVVQLGDGRTLAIGGSAGPERTGSRTVEAYEPMARAWRPAPAMADARIGHAAVLLSDGRVLVTGGQSRPGEYLRSAEIFDPRTDRWTSAGEMSDVRSVHHARLLADGSVLVIGGGTDESATNSVEIYDPKENTWTLVGAMREPRWGFASAVLADGRVLVAGGRVPGRKGFTMPEDVLALLDGVEIYDPTTRSWTQGPSMRIPRSMGLPNVELIPLGNGDVMFAGGRTYPAPYHGTNRTEIYSPATGTWVEGPAMRAGRSYQAAMVLPERGILIVGGRGTDFLPLAGTEFLPLRTAGRTRR